MRGERRERLLARLARSAPACAVGWRASPRRCATRAFAVGRARDGRRRAADRLPARRTSRAPARRAEGAVRLQSRANIERFDELFDAFWRGRGVKRAARGRRRAEPRIAPAASRPALAAGRGGPAGARGAQAPDAPAAEGHGRERGASAHEALSRKDFARLAGEAERAEALALAERLARALRARLSTRRERARQKGRRIDLRAHDAPLDRARRRADRPRFRRRKLKPLRLVALLDASGSMELYVSMFTRFLHACRADVPEVEAYPLPHAARACVFGAERAQSAARARPAVADGAGRRRRHADRRLPRGVQPLPREARRSIRAPA